MNVKPLGSRVLVKVLEKEQVTASGIVLPDTVDKEKKTEAKVIAVGPGKLLESGQRAQMEVTVGQTVIVKSWGGDEVEINNEAYKIFEADDILAIVE